MPSLLLDQITAEYDNRTVLKNLCGSFACGKINLVVGRAGSGKSTLLKVIAGFHKNFRGSVKLDDNDFVPAGNFSLTFQDPETLFFNATVVEEVAFALKMRGYSDSDSRALASDWMKRWGLDPGRYSDKHPLELSGGEKRRVALAACTVFTPPVIMLDEPLAGLDPDGQKALAGLLVEIAHQHIVIVVTHEPEYFLPHCDHILFLSRQQHSWYDFHSFVRAAIKQNDFYPLPHWYRQALKPFVDATELPFVEADAVYRFLATMRERNDCKL
jgi:energy-coupling factor transporter ATP-binding protein EcfA2